MSVQRVTGAPGQSGWFEVGSRTDPGTHYTVVWQSRGVAACSCRSFTYRGTCRHVDLVAHAIEEECPVSEHRPPSLAVHQNGPSAPPPDGLIEQVVIQGDLAKLAPAQRASYYAKVCDSLGLNPYTRPFDYLNLNGRLVLYARKDATDQLRRIHRVSLAVVSRETMGDLYVVTARATLPDGRADEEIGAVPIAGLRGEALANAMMKASCVPLDSEILTRDGFRGYDQVAVGDEVLAYDAESDQCRWTPLEAVSVFRAEDVGRLVRLQSKGGQFQAICTDDHSWAVVGHEYRADNRGDGSRGPRGPYRSRTALRRLVKTTEIKTSQKVILAAPERETSEGLLSPVEAAVLGWAVTDGTIKRVGNCQRIGICQSKEQNFPVIRELVATVAPGAKEIVSQARRRTFPTGLTYDTLPQHWWYIPAAVTRAILERAGFHDREDLPKIVTRLAPTARRAMLQAFMLAEGTARGSFINGDRHILEAFQILCALEGIATGDAVWYGAVFRQRLKKTRHTAGNGLEWRTLDAAPVWCPTTAFGTWVMRQGNRVMITGNTKAKRRVTLSIVGLGALDESEIESIPDARRVDVDAATGEIRDDRPPMERLQEPDASPPDQTLLDHARHLYAQCRDAGLAPERPAATDAETLQDWVSDWQHRLVRRIQERHEAAAAAEQAAAQQVAPAAPDDIPSAEEIWESIPSAAVQAAARTAALPPWADTPLGKEVFALLDEARDLGFDVQRFGEPAADADEAALKGWLSSKRKLVQQKRGGTP